MKKFVTHTLAFLLPIVFLGFIVEALLRRIPNDYKLKKAYLDHNASNVQTLILGNSHSFYGVDPKFLTTNSFNAASVSQSLNYDYYILKKYENHWTHLTQIVIPIDYFTLYKNLDIGSDLWRRKNYNLYYDMNVSSDIATNTELLSTRFKSNLTRLTSYYIFKNSLITTEALGWGNAYKGHKDLQKTARVALSRHTVKNYNLLADNVRTLTNIIKFAKARNIDVVFFTSPACKYYYDNVSQAQIGKTLSEVKKLKDAYGVKYVNLLDDKSFLDADFYDADHLNWAGAKKLSLKINHIVNHL
ncbi:MAG: hypothetical protein JWQ28_844 [Pedobacter sp.]|jgi:hypothetical protein|nr:hypothetical protein [Pedobacter sp.]